MPGKARAGPAGRSAQIGGVGIWEEGRQRDAGGFVFFGRSSDKAFDREVRKGIAKFAKKGVLCEPHRSGRPDFLRVLRGFSSRPSRLKAFTGSDGFLDGFVSRLGHVVSVEKESCALGLLACGAHPGILVGKAPGLDRIATGVGEADRGDLTINFRLRCEVHGGCVPVRVYGNPDIHFREVNLDAERGESGDVGVDASDVRMEIGDMHLQPNPIDGDAAALEVFHHGIDGI